MISLGGVLCFVNIFLISNSNGFLMVDQLRWDFLNLEENLWKFVLEQSKNGFNDTEDPGITMPQDILYGMEVIRQAPQFLFLYSDFRVVHDMYDKFRRFLNISSSADNNNLSEIDESETKMSFIIDEVLHDPKNNMNKTITNIFKQTFQDSENGYLINSIFDIILKNDYMCKQFKQSPQQVFFNLYNAISLAQLKGYIMVQFSYLAQRLVKKENYTHDSLIARKQFEKLSSDMAEILVSAMTIMPRTLWRCDPKQHIKGSTYDELTALLQGHIENEVDMNFKGTCTENCGAYSLSRSYGCYDSESMYCKKRKLCKGKIIGCKFVESQMTACFSPSSSSRRYQYIQYKSGKVLGKKMYCQGKSVNSWFRWFVHCSYCLCLCDQEGLHSDRYFNMRPVMADVAHNRVVTGLRIVKHNRIIHLQIQEGKLLPYGYIDDSTIRWVPVDDYTITDDGVQNGVDFHVMDYERRTLFLDDLMPHEASHLITGVRFEFIDNNLKFEINVRAFNFEKGIISNDSYYIFGGQNRNKINIYNPDVPTASPASENNFDANTYVEFTHSSFDKDAAQTTVPFFDTQPVASYPAAPLKRAGIYYKGKTGYGGFIAPTITTYDFSKHLNAEFPEIKPRKDPEDEFPILA
ncbi:uncharacterized protein LOC108911536 isoform X2 [Anoplophora glabripennis]|uniref:uncharacterized protein LOC108911536 isoform X2 n=1 Tax=Anoplophora glabripennis TaxID=217634 RepID=UPI000873A80C|nr:uncharacterized protein LOC108911536 isoform X2 [Anoplophora glabripennis]